MEENEVKNASELKDELMKKLENEYNEYKEQFMSLTPKEAVDNAYELVVKQEILDSFNYDMSYDKEELQALLKQDNLLSQAYDEWLSADGNLRVALEYSIDNVIEIYTHLYDKDVEQAMQNDHPLAKFKMNDAREYCAA